MSDAPRPEQTEPASPRATDGGAVPHAPPVAFPIPEFRDADLIFGAHASAYLTRGQLGEWYNDRTPFHHAAHCLFFRGGKLADFGLTIKDGIDQRKVYRAIKALLSSFEPKHEIKIGTVAVALANWCDYAATQPAASVTPNAPPPSASPKES